jgi:hypothetical protein
MKPQLILRPRVGNTDGVAQHQQQGRQWRGWMACRTNKPMRQYEAKNRHESLKVTSFTALLGMLDNPPGLVEVATA